MNKQPNSKAYAIILDQLDSVGAIEKSVERIEPSCSVEWDVEKNEGKLAVDIAHDDTHIFIISTMAGAVPDKIEVYVHNDLLTIRGVRHSPLEKNNGTEYFYNECFWGTFSRTIVLPVDVKGDLAKAKYESGILEIIIPKQNVDKKIPVKVVEE